MTNTQMIFTVLLPTVAVLVGILINHNGQNELRAEIRSVRDKVGELGERVARLEAK